MKTKILSGLWEISQKPNVIGIDHGLVIKIQNPDLSNRPVIAYINKSLFFYGWDYETDAKRKYKLICRANKQLEETAIKNIKDKLDSIE